MNGDGVQYYAYVRSTVIDRDLALDNEYDDAVPRFRSLAPRPARTRRGFRYAYAPVGAAVAWFAPFAVTHGVVTAVRALGIPIANDGYSDLYMFVTALTSWCVVLAGLLLVYQVARRWFSDEIACGAVLTGWLASPLFANAYELPMFAHAIDFGIVSALVYMTVTRGPGLAWREWFLIGLLTGWAVATRQQNVSYAALPFVYWIAAALKHRSQPWAAAGVAALVGGLVGFLPQIAMNVVLFGQPLVFHRVYLPHSVWPPRIGYVLWSWDNGLFSWTPLMAVAVAGLFVAACNHDRRRLAVVGATILCANVVLVGILPYGPVLIGQRYLINCVPFLILGLGAAAEQILSKAPRLAPAVIVVAAAAVVLNIDLETLRVFDAADLRQQPLGMVFLWHAVTVGPRFWTDHIRGLSINQPSFSAVHAMYQGLSGSVRLLAAGTMAIISVVAAAGGVYVVASAWGSEQRSRLAVRAAYVIASLPVAVAVLWLLTGAAPPPTH